MVFLICSARMRTRQVSKLKLNWTKTDSGVKCPVLSLYPRPHSPILRLYSVASKSPCEVLISEPFKQSRSAHSGGTVPSSLRSDVIRRTVSTANAFSKNENSTSNSWSISNISPILLRDMCTCSRCVDPSTHQKLFSTVDIPNNIVAYEEPNHDPGTLRLRWRNDINGFDNQHVTSIPLSEIEFLKFPKSSTLLGRLPRLRTWNSRDFRAEVQDLHYDAYMSDEIILFKALQQLATHGLLFLTGVPNSEKSVSAIAERIGPIKNTFYGYTWDVRSVPLAKNVAYTSQDLGFHMDLLYMKQPPHLQFLHCIRSSSTGGASLFTDSYRAVAELLKYHQDAFEALCNLPVHFHYNHPESHYYHQSRTVIEMQPLYFDTGHRGSLAEYSRKSEPASVSSRSESSMIKEKEIDFSNIDAVSWAPPFQAPFSHQINSREVSEESLSNLTNEIHRWHKAATSFNNLIQQPEGIYKRMMKPGECVIFDNRRILHARTAFEVGDMGKERWLRGAYVDKDPYMSKFKVLQAKLNTYENGL